MGSHDLWRPVERGGVAEILRQTELQHTCFGASKQLLHSGRCERSKMQGLVAATSYFHGDLGATLLIKNL